MEMLYLTSKCNKEEKICQKNIPQHNERWTWVWLSSVNCHLRNNTIRNQHSSLGLYRNMVCVCRNVKKRNQNKSNMDSSYSFAHSTFHIFVTIKPVRTQLLCHSFYSFGAKHEHIRSTRPNTSGIYKSCRFDWREKCADNNNSTIFYIFIKDNVYMFRESSQKHRRSIATESSANVLRHSHTDIQRHTGTIATNEISLHGNA